MGFKVGVNHVSEVHDPRIQLYPWSNPNATSLKRMTKRRRIFVMHNVIGATSYGVNENNLASLESCLTGRLFKMYKNGEYLDPLPYKGDKVFEDSFKRLARIKGCFSSRKSRKETVLSYTGRKRTLYSKAMETLSHTPVRPSDARSRFFQKYEKIDTSKIPRCIQPRSTRYHLELATFLKHEEHEVYNALAKMFGHDVVAKGKNINQTALMFENAFKEFDNPVAIGIDASKFDMHVRRQVLELEHSVYLYMYRHSPDLPLLTQLLKWQLHNKGSASTYDGKLTFQVEGTRFSGDINTSLGNVIIMCLIVYSFFDKYKFKHYRLIDNGDDAVIVLDRSNLHVLNPFNEYASTLGFRIVREEPVYKLEHVRFCQMAPIYAPNESSNYVMVREPHNLFQKDIMSTHDLRNLSIRRKWIYAVGAGGTAMYGNIPCLRDFYYSYMKQGNPKSRMCNDREISNMAFYYWGRNMEHTYESILDETRMSYYHAFGVPPHRQMLIEKRFQQVSWIDLEIMHQQLPNL